MTLSHYDSKSSSPTSIALLQAFIKLELKSLRKFWSAMTHISHGSWDLLCPGTLSWYCVPGFLEAKAERDVFLFQHCLLETEAVGEYCEGALFWEGSTYHIPQMHKADFTDRKTAREYSGYLPSHSDGGKKTKLEESTPLAEAWPYIASLRYKEGRPERCYTDAQWQARGAGQGT